MPSHRRDLRPDVLSAAETHGWEHDMDTTRHGAISDQFRRGKLTLTCFWTRSVQSDAYWSNGILYGVEPPRQVWHVAPSDRGVANRTPGVLEILAG